MYFLDRKLKVTVNLLEAEVISCQLLNCLEFPGSFYETNEAFTGSDVCCKRKEQNNVLSQLLLAKSS